MSYLLKLHDENGDYCKCVLFSVNNIWWTNLILTFQPLWLKYKRLKFLAVHCTLLVEGMSQGQRKYKMFSVRQYYFKSRKPQISQNVKNYISNVVAVVT